MIYLFYIRIIIFILIFERELIIKNYIKFLFFNEVFFFLNLCEIILWLMEDNWVYFWSWVDICVLELIGGLEFLKVFMG